MKPLEARESVAIAFISLLQRLPAKQRAVLLLKDAVGWSSEEIGAALEMTVASVSSALHRAREVMAARPAARSSDPPPDVLQNYVRSWEEHDLDSLVALLKNDVVLAMPPLSRFVQGADAVRHFLQLPRFGARWSKGFHGTPTRANGMTAIAWYAPGDDGAFRPHSLELARFDGGSIAETVHFIGAPYLRGFDIPDQRAPRGLTACCSPPTPLSTKAFGRRRWPSWTSSSRCRGDGCRLASDECGAGDLSMQR